MTHHNRPIRLYKDNHACWWGITNWSAGTQTFPSSWVQVSGFGFTVQIKWYIVIPVLLILAFAFGWAVATLW